MNHISHENDVILTDHWNGHWKPGHYGLLGLTSWYFGMLHNTVISYGTLAYDITVKLIMIQYHQL